MTESKTFIRLQNRNPNRPELTYATLCTPQRVGGKKINNEQWLGMVVDQENNIFFNKKDWYFQLSSDNSIVNLNDSDFFRYQKLDIGANIKTGFVKNQKLEKNNLLINLGASFALSEFIENYHFDGLINYNSPQEHDSILSLILYRIIENDRYSFAKEWWACDYLKYKYPYAKLQSQRISELLVKIGSESFFRNFFRNYLHFLENLNTKNNILIDSIGLSNTIKSPYTAINNNNGVISKEIRLITVYDKDSGHPIYYRYIPDNVVDIATLKSILFELQELGININRIILGAEYCSEDSISELYNMEIPFMTRLVPRYSIYNLLVNKYHKDIVNPDYYVEYGNRQVYVIKESIKLFKDEIPVFAYVCYDDDKRNIEMKDYMYEYDPNKISKAKFFEDISNFGIFILISTINLDKSALLPCYYARDSIEKFFDYLKNDIDLLPVRNHTDRTFHGQLMVCFISSIIYYAVDKQLSLKKLSISSSMKSLKLLNGRVYNSKILPSVATKQINSVLQALKIVLPDRISFDN